MLLPPKLEEASQATVEIINLADQLEQQLKNNGNTQIDKFQREFK